MVISCFMVIFKIIWLLNNNTRYQRRTSKHQGHLQRLKIARRKLYSSPGDYEMSPRSWELVSYISYIADSILFKIQMSLSLSHINCITAAYNQSNFAASV